MSCLYSFTCRHLVQIRGVNKAGLTGLLSTSLWNGLETHLGKERRNGAADAAIIFHFSAQFLPTFISQLYTQPIKNNQSSNILKVKKTQLFLNMFYYKC